MSFKEIQVKEIQGNPWEMIGDQWMLITAEHEGRVNTMTASWGGFGIMWGKEVATVYIRPQRQTKVLMDAEDTFTISMFRGGQKKAMGYLGSVSGKDEPDKITKTDLHVAELDGEPIFEEAELVLICRKMYAQEMKPENFIDTDQIGKWFPDGDFHTMYIAEIMKAYEKA